MARGGQHGSFALTAAGVVALMSAGVYEGPEISQGLAWLNQYPPRGAIHDGYFFYGHYYAAQAMWHAGGELWSNWYTAIRDTLLKQQQPSGAWSDPGGGDELGTAMGCLILQLPLNFIPVFGEG
jgi:hypothetical protein